MLLFLHQKSKYSSAQCGLVYLLLAKKTNMWYFCIFAGDSERQWEKGCNQSWGRSEEEEMIYYVLKVHNILISFYDARNKLLLACRHKQRYNGSQFLTNQ